MARKKHRWCLLNDRKWKYLLLLPIVILICSSMLNNVIVDEINNVMLQEKIMEVDAIVDLIARGVEWATVETREQYERSLIDTVEMLDQYYQVYAAVYSRETGEFRLLTMRYYETEPFEPFDYPELIEAVENNLKGNVVINWSPVNQPGPFDLYVHFHWTPSHFEKSMQYLILGGVSKHSIIHQVSNLASYVPIMETTIVFLLTLWLVLMITRLGYIYDLRAGPTKWRDEEEGD